MSKKVLLTTLAWAISLTISYCQSIQGFDSKPALLVIKQASIVAFVLETTTSGKISLTQEEFIYKSDTCPHIENTRFSRFVARQTPCNNHLIKDIHLKYEDIYEVTQLNYLLIFRNRLHIATKDGRTFRFAIRQRRKLFYEIIQRLRR
jgi:hypothetical protein